MINNILLVIGIIFCLSVLVSSVVLFNAIYRYIHSERKLKKDE